LPSYRIAPALKAALINGVCYNVSKAENLMALFDDEEKLMNADDGQEPPEEDPVDREERQYLGLKIFLCTIPVIFLIWFFGGTMTLGLNAGICLGMNALAVLSCWELRRCWWFWCVIAFMLALNEPLVVKIQWPNHWVPGVELLPIGFADFLATVAVVRFVQKFIFRYVPPEPEEDD